MSRLAGLRERLMAPVDATGLAVARMGIGALITWEVWREIDHGLIRADYVEPRILFRWWLFDWVRPLPGRWLFFAFFVLAASGLFVAAGWFYRKAAFVMTVGMTYWFLLEKARYLNHRYLACLFALLLVLVPAHSTWSMDARRKPGVRSDVIPAWPLWLFRFQVGAPYFFAGVAKLNFDWLGRGEPLAMWLGRETDFPIVGALFTSHPFVRTLAFASTALDLCAPFLLLNRRTRAFAYGATLVFHFMNSRLFNIGMFPWMMILATTVFFDPDWPRQILRTVREGARAVRASIVGGFVVGFVVGGLLPRSFSGVKAIIGGIGVAVCVFHLVADRSKATEARPVVSMPWRRFAFGRALAVLLTLWIGVQLLLPLRHFAIPGNAHWTEEGNRFAWHMLLHEKSGSALFHIAAGDELLPVDFVVTDHLTQFQIRKMVQNPDLLVQFAHYIEDFYRSLGVTDDVEVRVDTEVSLNGRPRAAMIDPLKDLTQVRRPYLPPADWILPLPDYR